MLGKLYFEFNNLFILHCAFPFKRRTSSLRLSFPLAKLLMLFPLTNLGLTIKLFNSASSTSRIMLKLFRIKKLFSIAHEQTIRPTRFGLYLSWRSPKIHRHRIFKTPITRSIICWIDRTLRLKLTSPL